MLIDGELYDCQCCSAVGLTKNEVIDHVKTHKLSFRQYYDKYLKCAHDGMCVVCGSPTSFKSEKRAFANGYLKYCKPHSKGFTLEKCIVKYGSVIGKRKFDEYVQKHRFKNTFEGKKQKYGWTKEQFEEFNRSRSVTQKTMTKKYGAEEGTRRFETYCELQRHAGCSKQYFIEKYGVEDGTKRYEDLNRQKSHSYESYIEKYKDPELARIKLKEYFETRSVQLPASKISQSLFSDIVDKIGTDHVYFSSLNKEFGMMGDKKYYFYDFCDTISKTVIEFHGIKFHVKDPTKEFVQLYSGKSKEYVLEHDRKKEECAKNRGFNYWVIWEDDYLNDKKAVTDELCRKLIELRSA